MFVYDHGMNALWITRPKSPLTEEKYERMIVPKMAFRPVSFKRGI